MVRASRSNVTRASGARPSEGDSPDPVDIHVGQRLRQRRTLLGLSQEKLARTIGLTFQQIQKYERGVNRIGASRLLQLSRALGVPIAYFFEDMPPTDPPARGRDKAATAEAKAPETMMRDPFARRETLQLVRAYYGIANPFVRKRILDLVRSLAAAE